METYTLEALTIDAYYVVRCREVPGGPWTVIEILRTPVTPGLPAPAELSLPISNPAPATGEPRQALAFIGGGGGVLDYIILDPAVPSHWPIYDLALNEIKDPQRALEIVRAEILRITPGTQTRYFSSWQFPVMAFPDDLRLVSAAQTWVASADPRRRFFAARVFQHFPDPQDLPRLRSLLADPSVEDLPIWLSPWSRHDYVVRQAAAEALVANGEPVPPVVLSLPRNDLYRPFFFFPMLLLATPLVFHLVWRIITRRMRPFRSLRHELAAVLTTLSFAGALYTAALWIRSYYTADNVVVAHAGFMVDVTSIQGELWIEAVARWPGGTPCVHFAVTPSPPQVPGLGNVVSFRNDAGLGQALSLQERYVFSELSWRLALSPRYLAFDYPFSYPYGRPLRSPVSPARTLLIAHPYLIATCLLFPAARLAMRTYHRHKASQRRAQNLCITCGYDLRTHDPAARCPECGTPRPELLQQRSFLTPATYPPAPPPFQ